MLQTSDVQDLTYSYCAAALVYTKHPNIDSHVVSLMTKYNKLPAKTNVPYSAATDDVSWSRDIRSLLCDFSFWIPLVGAVKANEDR